MLLALLLSLLLTVLAWPPGSEVLVSAGDDEVLIAGDLLVHAVQMVRPEVAYTYDMDAERARAGRRAVLARYRELAVSHLGVPFVRTGA